MAETDGKTIDAHLLISSDRVEGTAVYNPDGEKLGTVSSLMINKATGQVEYVVLAFGGIFGLGSDHYPLPWAKIQYDVAKHGYVADLTRDQLLNAPRYPADERPEFDADFYTGINSFYGIGFW